MKKCILLLTLAIASSAACAQGSDGSNSAAADALGPGEVAFVNDQRIPESIFRLFTISNFQVNPDDLNADDRKQIVNRLAAIFLMAKEAERNGLDTERRIAAELELQRLQTLARFMADRYAQENPATQEELQALYEANLPRLSSPQYKVRHILVATKDEADDLIKKLDDGGDFAKLASQNSIDSSASEGGELGWISADQVDQKFWAAVTTTEPGNYFADPVQTQYGWHVIEVEDMQERDPPSLADARDEVENAVEAQKVNAYINSLLNDADVRIVE